MARGYFLAGGPPELRWRGPRYLVGLGQDGKDTRRSRGSGLDRNVAAPRQGNATERRREQEHSRAQAVVLDAGLDIGATGARRFWNRAGVGSRATP